MAARGKHQAICDMNCCTPTGYGTIFGAKTVERDARRYRRKGLTGTARWLHQRLITDGVSDRSVLEVGGGIGGLQIELLEAGARFATNVEIVDSYEASARALIDEHGLETRVERRIGDFAQDRDQAPAADIVIMHRVICCYPDADALMGAACARARDRVAITIPRDVWWVRLGFGAMNAWLHLRRIAFRGYVHRPARIILVANRHGFDAVQKQRGLLWESLVLQHHAAERERESAAAGLAAV